MQASEEPAREAAEGTEGNEPHDVPSLIAKMSEHTREALEKMQPLSDCKVETGDGMQFHLHKSVLARASSIFRYERSHAHAYGSACTGGHMCHVFIRKS